MPMFQLCRLPSIHEQTIMTAVLHVHSVTRAFMATHDSTHVLTALSWQRIPAQRHNTLASQKQQTQECAVVDFSTKKRDVIPRRSRESNNTTRKKSAFQAISLPETEASPDPTVGADPLDFFGNPAAVRTSGSCSMPRYAQVNLLPHVCSKSTQACLIEACRTAPVQRALTSTLNPQAGLHPCSSFLFSLE